MPTRLTGTALVLLLTATLAGPALAQGNTKRAGTTRSVAGGTAWAALTAEQKMALEPLRELWPTLGADNQRKWLAIAQNYDHLSEEEQATLQRRMTEWARLSPAQRARARLNFGEVRRMPGEEKRARWEEYQALPEKEREQLARDRPKPPAGAAPALRPAPPSQIIRPVSTPPPPAEAASRPARGRPPIDRNTLLPLAPLQPQR